MQKLLIVFLLIPSICISAEWQATPYNCIVLKHGSYNQYFFGEEGRGITVLEGTVVISPDTLWQKSASGEETYFLEPWVLIGDTVQFDATAQGVSKIDGMWRVDLKAIIRVKHLNGESKNAR